MLNKNIEDILAERIVTRMQETNEVFIDASYRLDSVFSTNIN